MNFNDPDIKHAIQEKIVGSVQSRFSLACLNGWFDPAIAVEKGHSYVQDLLVDVGTALASRPDVVLREALEACKERFDEYEAHHRTKPDHAKADRNKEMSELCRKALET